MNILDLIDALQEIADEHGDIDVRLAHQPRWAFEYSIQRDVPVAAARVKNDGRSQMVAYIAEGSQIGYLPQSAAVAIDWAEADEDDEDDKDACPGCGCLPGDGVTDGCTHPLGCGFEKADSDEGAKR